MTDLASAPTTDSAPLADLAGKVGGRLVVTGYGTELDLAAPSMDRIRCGVACLLPDIGLLTVTGAQADSFLQAQLTNDVEQLATDAAQWNGYCSPKGRLLATFLNWKQGPDFQLALSKPLAEPIRKRLSMFILRAKAKVLDRSDAGIALGLVGAQALAVLHALGLATPPVMQVAHGEGLTAVRLAPVRSAADTAGAPVPDAASRSLPAAPPPDLERVLLWVAYERIAAVVDTLAAQMPFAGTSLWRWTEVQAGVPRVVAATHERFVPQMVNFELVGGVNFKKGCYPGQEIVARSQYLGKLKRRMFAGHVAAEVPAGADVVPAGGGEPSGMVVLAAPSPHGGCDLLFESQSAAVEAGVLQVAGQAIRVLALPYPMSNA